MSEIRSLSVDVHGVNLHCYQTGWGKQPLIFAHGITDDGMCWSSVADEFLDTFNIFMVDARGHGKSDAPDNGYILRNLAEDLSGLIEELRLQRPILIGHSMGAITSLVLAGLFPDIPHAVILVDPPAFWNYDASDSKWNENRISISTWIHSIKRKTKEELMEEAHTKLWTDADRATWVDAKQRVSIKVIELVTPSDIPNLDFPNLVSNIKCPLLFVQGDIQYGAISGDEDVAKLKTHHPNLQKVFIPKASHSIHRTQHEPFMNAIKTFLAGLPTLDS